MGFHLRYNPETCRDFDLMIERFNEWYEERLNRTEDVPVPESDQKAKPTRPERVFHTLREVLGYDAIDGDHESGLFGPQASSLSASEAELLERIETGQLSEEERARFGE